ncbi:hypothetical protein SPONN_283 [uncultured Candidatus Thioglobus sp.]|nr:hypothetical protein SPONN_283 [uncultured Candidatus Thioglobus sp.]
MGISILLQFYFVYRVLKDLQSWKEAPLDCMALSLYQLQAYYYNEIERGLSGLGQYTLALTHSSLKVQEFDYLPTSSPEEIVKRIRDGNIISHEACSAENAEKVSSSNWSSLARAQAILQADNITFDMKLHCFNVKGSSGTTRVVTLFPKESCSCPSTGDCYHRLAVRLCLGMATTKTKAQHNLTQLRKKTRNRNEKKSGRKRPRPNDEDIVPCSKYIITA